MMPTYTYRGVVFADTEFDLKQGVLRRCSSTAEEAVKVILNNPVRETERPIIVYDFN